MSTPASQMPAAERSTEATPLRFVTAASLFDGHDAAINIMRRLIQAQGVEVVHLGHNRSVEDVVRAALHNSVRAAVLAQGFQERRHPGGDRAHARAGRPPAQGNPPAPESRHPNPVRGRVATTDARQD